jgi:hypothetical protein
MYLFYHKNQMTGEKENKKEKMSGKIRRERTGEKKTD